MANRGEIAMRVIKSAHASGYTTVAVYSDADAKAPHVLAADQAVRIGPPEVGESYLKTEAILEAAQATGAEAVHPGYGFLSENADFAKACEKAGLVFIGPGPEAIELMGNKRLAKLRMEAAGVPCVPGYSGAEQGDEALIQEAEKIGFPLMVKAAAGGGGRGMRLVMEPSALAAALASGRSEAQNAFGSGELILEKAILKPRHVEIQVFADKHGNTIHLGERDCSVQRRHQKVIEEAPSPAVDAELRAAMGAAAVKAASEIGYVGAGTVEFLLDESRDFYFLEMNTRLQVEHPVTEMITGLDLVDWQLQVAAGKTLPLTQEQVVFSGHAMEVRLYAENPYRGFLPQTGQVKAWNVAQGPGLRTDHGLAEGLEVSSYYDPMLAKVVAHGKDREEARRRLIKALEKTVLLGVNTNRDFLIEMLSHSVFIHGGATTAFIGGDFSISTPALESPVAALAAALFYKGPQEAQPWRTRALNAEVKMEWGKESLSLEVVFLPNGRFEITHEGKTHALELFEEMPLSGGGKTVRYALGNKQGMAAIHQDGETLCLSVGQFSGSFREINTGRGAGADGANDGRLLAPMNGRIMAVKAGVGDEVKKGQCILVLEAMKMEHEIIADGNGTLASLPVAEGDQVSSRQLLAEITPES